MTSRSGNRGDGSLRQQVSADPGREAQTTRVRRDSTSLYALVMAVAIAVFAGMMITSTPSPASAAQSPTTAGDMPGMDHGSAPVSSGTPSPTMAGDMPGMDHGSGPVPSSTPSPTMASTPPGTDHSDGHGSSPSPTSSADSPWKVHDHSDSGAHEHGSTPSPTASAGGHGTEHGSADKPGADSGHGETREVARDRPLAAVLGTFGGVSSAVMLSAAFLRRKDRPHTQAQQAARAARKAQK